MESLYQSIKDAVGNDANLSLATPGASGSLGANNSLIIDTTKPTLTSSSPADDATYVSVVSNIVLNFSEAVDVNTGGEILIKKASDDEIYETININD